MKFHVGHYDNTGTEAELNSKPPGKEILNDKERTVIRLFVMNLMKPRIGQVESNDKRNRYYKNSSQKGGSSHPSIADRRKTKEHLFVESPIHPPIPCSLDN